MFCFFIIQNHRKTIHNSGSRIFQNLGPPENERYSFVSSKFPFWTKSNKPFRRKSKMSPRCSIFQQWKMIHNSRCRVFQNTGPTGNERYSSGSSKFTLWRKSLEPFWRKSKMSRFGTTFSSKSGIPDLFSKIRLCHLSVFIKP